MSTDPVAHFRDVATTRPRCFWLDGGGAREWSGRRSIIGWLDEDDASLAYDAHLRRVTRHRGGRAEVVGDDIFAALERELAAGGAGDQWFGYLGYAARPDLPARRSAPGDLPDAVWMRPSHVRLFDQKACSISLTVPEAVTRRLLRGTFRMATPSVCSQSETSRTDRSSGAKRSRNCFGVSHRR